MKKICVNMQIILLSTALFIIQFATFTKNIVSITNYSQNLVNIAIGILFINSIYVLSKLKATIKEWGIYFTMLALSLISFIITDDSLMIQLFLTTVSAIKLDFKKLIRSDIVFKIILLIFIVLCYYNEHVITRIFIREGELRYSYGFNHPNTFGYFLLILFFEIIYIKNTNIKLYKIYILFFIIYHFIDLASSRSSQISICLFMLMYTIYYIKSKRIIQHNRNKKNNINTCKIIKLLFPVLTIVSIILTKEFIKGSQLAIKIDELFSERLLLQGMFLETYNINLVGNNIFYFETLDNVYIRTLLNYGILISILYSFIYNKITIKAINKKDKIIVMIILVFFIYGLMEWYIIKPAVNIFLLYFSSTIADKNKKIKRVIES